MSVLGVDSWQTSVKMGLLKDPSYTTFDILSKPIFWGGLGTFTDDNPTVILITTTVLVQFRTRRVTRGGPGAVLSVP